MSNPSKLSYEPNAKLIEVHGPLTGESGVVSKAEVPDVVAKFVGSLPNNKALLLQQIENPKGLVIKLQLP